MHVLFSMTENMFTHDAAHSEFFHMFFRVNIYLTHLYNLYTYVLFL